MAIELTDDGTMDTVLRCSECGQELRYNYDSSQADEVDPNDDGDCYDAFVEWAIEDATNEHECEAIDDESNGPQDEDLVTSDGRRFYSHGGPARLAFEITETVSGHYRVYAPRVNVPGRYATVERAIRAYLNVTKFWPNVWSISDHGNAHLMDLGRA